MASKQPDLTLMRRAYHLYHVERMSIRQIAAELDLYRDGKPRFGKVQRMVADYGKRYRVMDELQQRAERAEAENAELKAKVLTLNFTPPPVNTYDLEQWQDTLADFRRRQYITVSHMSDLHFGDHDEDAIEMHYALVEQKQPDVIVVGSDTADFSVISHFAPDPDDYESIQDVLDDFSQHWRPHIERLQKIAKNAVLVMILGNHELRIKTFVEENAPKFRKTIERAWIDAIRYQNRVLYIGHTQEVEIGHLLVKHGDVTSEHTSKALLDRVSYQMSVMAGHIHRETSYTRQGRKYMVKAITGGCAQNLNPKYILRKGLTPPRPWVHGTAFATVDMGSTFVDFENIVYQRMGNVLVANCGGKLIQQPLAAARENVA